MPGKQEERRGAERLVLPKSVPATFGGFSARIAELSLIGCQIEHADRVAARSRLPLRFKWRGSVIRVDATLTRSEMRAIAGKPAYVSGLEFCQSPEESPAVIREIVDWLNRERAKNAAPAPAPAPAVEPAEDDAEVMSADFLQCVFSDGEWVKLYVNDPRQPKDGFTIAAPSNETEVDVLCRAYEKAGADKRLAMRRTFELVIAEKRNR
jgi:hypothetical protein